jgi:cytochrome P450
MTAEQNVSYERAREAPNTASLPLIGSVAHIAHYGLLNLLEREWRRHGDTFRMQLGARRLLAVVHPDSIERVLGSGRENYVKAGAYDNFRILADGLLTFEGDAWRTRRRLEQPSFHRESIQKFTERMVSTTREAIDTLRAEHPSGGVIDVHREMMRLTLEIVGVTLFGQRIGSNAADRSGRAFAEALELMSDRGNSPVQLPLKIPTPGNLRFRRVLQTLDRMVLDIVAKARAGRAQKANEPASTLLEMLLDARDAETGATLNDQDVRNEVVTLFLAGHETTALLLTWGFTVLAREPAVVAQMRAEIARIVGDREPTPADVPKLQYVRRVIDEILRLRAPVYSTARDVVADDVLGGFRIRAGEIALPVIFLTHRHPAFWPDPDRFDPDRFLPEAVKARHHWAYLPFSLGPRMCIGNIFSLVEATVIFTMLLQHVEFEIDPTRVPPPKAAITMRPDGPVPMKIRWRH